MNLEEQNINQIKEELKVKLENAENKSEAICEVIESYFEQRYSNLIEKIKLEASMAESDKEYAKSLGLRTLSKQEKEFYEKIKDVKQAVAGSQIDLIPTSIIDLTLENIRKDDQLLNHVIFAPANVTKWYTATKTGSYAWAKLTAALDKQKDIQAAFNVINAELGKLYVLIIIPKAISNLALPFIDKYFMAVLEEQERDGLTHGFLLGDGVQQPIGIYKQINAVDSSTQAHKDKAVNTDITKFSPKGLAKAKKTLTNEGKRTLSKLIFICNPSDRADYVDPALFDDEGNLKSSIKNLEIIDTPENPQGKAALYLDNTYTLACSKMEVNNYNQTLALEDADLIIGTAYANGRAVDDNCAYIFDVTKLEEYIPKVAVVGEVKTQSTVVPEA